MTRIADLTVRPGHFIEIDEIPFQDLKRLGLINSEYVDLKEEIPTPEVSPRPRKGSATKKEVDTK